MTILNKGDTAPDFDLDDGTKASQVWNKQHVVLFFFPKAFTPG